MRTLYMYMYMYHAHAYMCVETLYMYVNYKSHDSSFHIYTSLILHVQYAQVIVTCT